MSFKQTDFCYECKKQPDNLLSLQCGHDLCLSCSSLQYYKFSFQKKNFTCQICGKVTPLDHSSIYELEKLIISHPPEENALHNIGREEDKRAPYMERILQDQIKKIDNYTNINKGMQRNILSNDEPQRIGFKDNYSWIQQQFQSRNINQKSFTQGNEDDREYSKNEHSRYQQISFLEDNQKICKQHDDEEVNYFCFDCKNVCICPECIIHGVHKDHNVKTIKKSYPIVKQILEDYKFDLENSMTTINNKKEAVYQQKNEIQQIQKNLKLEITTVFNVLKQKVDETCQQLIQQTEEISKKSQRDLDETIKQIEKQIINFKKNEEQIQEHLQIKEEYKVINYYGLNSKSIDEKALLNNNSILHEQFQIAKQIFSNHINKKNQFLNIKSLIEDQIFELQNIEKKFQGQIQNTNSICTYTEDQEQVTLPKNSQDKNKENTNSSEDFKYLIDKKYDMLEKKQDLAEKRNEFLDRRLLNASNTSFMNNLQSQESLGISRQLDQDFEKMKENLKRSSQYRASSLRKNINTESKDQEVFNMSYNIKNSKI
ncbi:hypothetical protein ABPG72_002971 [Tetrahymena utriculariae]